MNRPQFADVEELRHSEQRLLRALRVAQVGSWEWDVARDSIVWSDELYRIFGVRPQEFEASYAAYLELVFPDDRANVNEIVSASLGRGEPFEFDHRVERGEGEIVVIHALGEVIKDTDGNVVRMVGTAKDVTELRDKEAQLRESEERALLASRQKSLFLANMSHEIRTPLAGVVGITELLADSALTPNQREYVDALWAAASSLLGLLNDILDLSKIDAGKVTLEAVDCNLRALVDETISLFSVAARAKGIELRSDFGASTPEWVRIDPARLRQVFGNIVGNAVKFTERGRVTLGAKRFGDRLVFTVADTGIGIAEADRDRVMSPFEQGDVSTTRKFGGTGLGLAICRELTGLMGGSISLDSVLGEGTTFTVDLPFVRGTAPASAPVVSHLPPPAAHGRGRVLLAEDTPVNQLVARAMLEKAGWTVEVVDDGQAALDALARSDFDVVILDCQMPVLDGFSAATAIREITGPAGRVPILAMTASALPGDKERCMAAGMDDYVTKPISRAALADAMERIVAVRASA